MEVTSKPIQSIEKKGEPMVLGVKGCKTYRKALETLIGTNYKKRNTESEFYTRGLLELYNKFHPEKILEVEANQWKEKSSIEIIKELDKLIIVKYQKPSQNEEPKEVRTEASREELIALIDSLKHCNRFFNEIKTSNLAMDYSIRLNLGHSDWKRFFADRINHNKLTLMLNALQELGFIEYSGGITKLLNKDISIQLVL